MDLTTIIAVPTIAIICALLAQGYKGFVNDENMNKHIPALCGAAGLVLGVACFYLTPGFIPAENAIVAAAVGIASGWSATGGHQIYKQYAGEEE